MKGKDGTDPKEANTVTLSSGRTSRPSSAPDTSSLSSFLYQEELCKVSRMQLVLNIGLTFT